MSHTVKGVLDGKRRGCDFRVLVEQRVEWVVDMIDEIYRDRLKTASVLGGKGGIVLETNQLCVAVVGCQIVAGKKIRAEYSRLNIGDDEIKSERLITNLDGNVDSAEAIDIGAVSGFELGLVGTTESLLVSWRNDG